MHVEGFLKQDNVQGKVGKVKEENFQCFLMSFLNNVAKSAKNVP